MKKVILVTKLIINKLKNKNIIIAINKLKIAVIGSINPNNLNLKL